MAEGAGSLVRGAALTFAPPVRLTSPIRGLAVAIGVLGSVIVYGIVGYVVLEHYPWIDAVFMTTETITTVGYGVVHPLDGVGQIFTISLIIFGVAGFLYTFGVIVESISSGNWRSFWKERRMGRSINQLSDHVIVCGYGRTGRQVVAELRQLGSQYCVVEKNPESLQDVHEADEPHVVGDAASDEVLITAGITRAKALISAVDSDERNVYIVLTARALQPKLSIVARASYPDSIEKLHRAGADRVVSPYTLAGHQMAALALQPAVVDVLDMVVHSHGSGMAIEELVVPAGLRFSASDLRKSGVALLARRAASGDLSVSPQDDELFGPDDLVIAMGTRQQLQELGNFMRPGAS